MRTCEICASRRVDFKECGACAFKSCWKCTSKYALENDDCMRCHELHPPTFFDDMPRAVHLARERRMVDRVYSEQLMMVPSAQPYAKYAETVENIQEQIEQLKQKMSALAKPPLLGEMHVSCPRPGCAGYVSLIRNTCARCDEKWCPMCRCLHAEDAPCNSEDMLSQDTIANTTRACPKCGVHIQKSSGCNDMFCTRCHTPFNWRTGEVIRRSYHNPHATRALRPDDPETRCAGIPLVSEVTQYHEWVPSSRGYRHTRGICVTCRTDLVNTIPLRRRLNAMKAVDFDTKLAFARVEEVRKPNPEAFKANVAAIERRRIMYASLGDIIETHICVVSNIYDNFVFSCKRTRNKKPSTAEERRKLDEDILQHHVDVHEQSAKHVQLMKDELDKLRKRSGDVSGIKAIRELIIGDHDLEPPLGVGILE